MGEWGQAERGLSCATAMGQIRGGATIRPRRNTVHLHWYPILAFVVFVGIFVLALKLDERHARRKR